MRSRSTRSTCIDRAVTHTTQSNDERNQGAHLPAVALIVLSEDFGEPSLFETELPPERHEGDRYGQNRPPFVACDRRADDGEQDAGVDRMTHVAIGPVAHERVVLLDGHCGTPVAGEMHARPY